MEILSRQIKNPLAKQSLIFRFKWVCDGDIIRFKGRHYCKTAIHENGILVLPAHPEDHGCLFGVALPGILILHYEPKTSQIFIFPL